MTKRLLLTGAAGFTGQHLSRTAKAVGYEVFPLQSNLLDAKGLHDEVLKINPTHVAHLAALSAVTHSDQESFYQVNLFGTINLLDALLKHPDELSSILLASSANIYGNISEEKISEASPPKPINHYAMSKLAMEYMAANYLHKLPLIFARPFNYTGVGHGNQFVIPKIIDHLKRGEAAIELGNLDVFREYNDVRMVCDAYLKLLEFGTSGEAYNICTGSTYALHEVVSLAKEIAGKNIEVKINSSFIRPNEVRSLKGDPTKLNLAIGGLQSYKLEETLLWMLR